MFFLLYSLAIFIVHVWICVPNATQAKVILSCARSPYSLPDLLVTGFRYLRAVGAPPQLWHSFDTTLVQLWHNSSHNFVFCQHKVNFVQSNIFASNHMTRQKMDYVRSLRQSDKVLLPRWRRLTCYTTENSKVFIWQAEWWSNKNWF